MSVTKKFVLTTLSLLLSVVLHAQVLTGIDVLQMNGFEELIWWRSMALSTVFVAMPTPATT